MAGDLRSVHHLKAVGSIMVSAAARSGSAFATLARVTARTLFCSPLCAGFDRPAVLVAALRCATT